MRQIEYVRLITYGSQMYYVSVHRKMHCPGLEWWRGPLE